MKILLNRMSILSTTVSTFKGASGILAALTINSAESKLIPTEFLA